MALSRFEYVKQFERDERLLPNCWLVVRVDGRGFHRFSDAHAFRKPNDEAALDVMTAAATAVMRDCDDCVLAYGASDEFSFVLRPTTTLFQRREHKLTTSIVSTFTAAYVFNWPRLMGAERPLQHLPSFDGRVVCYPSDKNIRDYLSWRQADCHINNLFNLVYWTLVHDGETRDAAKTLTSSLDAAGKNELLFSRFGTNYAKQPARHRKGTTLIRVFDAGDDDDDDDDDDDGAAAPASSSSASDAFAAAAAVTAVAVPVEPFEALTTAETTPVVDIEGATAAEPSGSGGGSGGGGSGGGSGGKRAPRRPRQRIAEVHEDLIGDAFWTQHPGIVPCEAASTRGAMRKARARAKKAAFRATQSTQSRPTKN
jgi:tRNA(His) guanylyltransferase